MKCDNSLVFLDSSSSSPQPSSSSVLLSQFSSSGQDESQDHKDMQLIYNKKRRFHYNSNNKMGPASLTPSSRASQDGDLGEGGASDDPEGSGQGDLYDEKQSPKSKVHEMKSKLLMTPNLYKSFLANAFREQKSSSSNPPKLMGSNGELRSSLNSVTSLSGGLHIFPRNLLFSCSADRKSPASPSQSWSQSRPNTSSSPTKQEVLKLDIS